MNDHQPPAHYDATQGRSTATFQRSPLKLKSKVPAKSAQPKGHEAFLKAIETTGAEITIDLLDDPNPVVGTIKHSDKYTISVRREFPDGTYQVYVVFKHAIRMFWTTPKKDAEAETTQAVH